MFPFVLILEASVGPIFVKYVFNLLAILLLSVIVSPSTLNKHGMCFLMLFLFFFFFRCIFCIVFVFVKGVLIICSLGLVYIVF